MYGQRERKVAHAHHLPKHKYEIRIFRACAFRAKNPECYGFFWQCKRYNKTPRFFWILVFANVNGPSMRFGVFRACAFLAKKTPRAVYTCIKKPDSFVHSGFSWKVARQLPLNTAKKNRIEKPTSGVGFFFNSAGFSVFFGQCKRLLQSRRVLFGFLVTWYVTFSGITRPRPAT